MLHIVHTSYTVVCVQDKVEYGDSVTTCTWSSSIETVPQQACGSKKNVKCLTPSFIFAECFPVVCGGVT